MIKRELWEIHTCFPNLNGSSLSTFSLLILPQLRPKYKLQHGGEEIQSWVSWALQCGSCISSASPQTIWEGNLQAGDFMLVVWSEKSLHFLVPHFEVGKQWVATCCRSLLYAGHHVVMAGRSTHHVPHSYGGACRDTWVSKSNWAKMLWYVLVLSASLTVAHIYMYLKEQAWRARLVDGTTSDGHSGWLKIDIASNTLHEIQRTKSIRLVCVASVNPCKPLWGSKMVQWTLWRLVLDNHLK